MTCQDDARTPHPPAVQDIEYALNPTDRGRQDAALELLARFCHADQLRALDFAVVAAVVAGERAPDMVSAVSWLIDQGCRPAYAHGER